MTKNRTPTPIYLDPGMHPGLEVKGLKRAPKVLNIVSSTAPDLPVGHIGGGGEANLNLFSPARSILEIRLDS